MTRQRLNMALLVCRAPGSSGAAKHACRRGPRGCRAARACGAGHAPWALTPLSGTCHAHVSSGAVQAPCCPVAAR